MFSLRLFKKKNHLFCNHFVHVETICNICVNHYLYRKIPFSIASYSLNGVLIKIEYVKDSSVKRPQHRNYMYPALFDKCVGPFKLPIERRETETNSSTSLSTDILAISFSNFSFFVNFFTINFSILTLLGSVFGYFQRRAL